MDGGTLKMKPAQVALLQGNITIVSPQVREKSKKGEEEGGDIGGGTEAGLLVKASLNPGEGRIISK